MSYSAAYSFFPGLIIFTSYLYPSTSSLTHTHTHSNLLAFRNLIYTAPNIAVTLLLSGSLTLPSLYINKVTTLSLSQARISHFLSLGSVEASALVQLWRQLLPIRSPNSNLRSLLSARSGISSSDTPPIRFYGSDCYANCDLSLIFFVFCVLQRE